MSYEKNKLVQEKLVEKWLPAIEGKGKWEKVIAEAPKVPSNHYGTVAMMLENTAKVVEKVLQEKTVSGDIAKYTPVLIPMIRRIAPALISNEIFGVQPLSGPSGLIFMLKAYYAGTTDNPVKPSNSVALTLADASAFTEGGDITSEGGAKGKVIFKDGNNLLVKVTAGTFALGEKVDNADPYSAEETTIASIYENEAIIQMLFPHYTGAYDTADAEALSTDMKEIGFEIISKTVEAKSRKLKAKWSLELEEDLSAVHNLSAEQILSSLSSQEIANELNREFIADVDYYASQGSVGTWDYSSADGRWEVEKYQNFIAKINRERKVIAKKSKRGQANWMIVSSDIASMLESSGRLNTTGVDPYNETFVGTLEGMKVFVDIWADSNYVLLGYKGMDETDAGFFYAPYIPLKITKGMGEEDGQPRLFFRTRYGKAENPVGAKNYFSKIVVNNLPY